MSKDPYVYDDTNVLKNLANIKEQHKLDDYETKGTIHGFDIVQKAKTTQKALTQRITFMKKQFDKSLCK